MRTRWMLFLPALLVAGCDDNGTSVRDVTPPAAPRGVYTVTGDGEVMVHWLANTERDVAGYRIYQAPCASGGDCPYDRIGATTGSDFRVTGLANGVTRYYAVAAYDRAGNESDLSSETLFDTPRPEGLARVLNNFLDTDAGTGYDFSARVTRAYGDTTADMFYGDDSKVQQMFVPDYQTDIQDAGYATSLDAVDFAPSGGWAPSGAVELIVGHCYVVWTRDDHYAKFRVTDIRPPVADVPGKVVFDWAYQVDRGNRELRARKSKDGRMGAPRPLFWAKPSQA